MKWGSSIFCKHYIKKDRTIKIHGIKTCGNKMCTWNECLDLEVTVFVAPSAAVVVDGHMLHPPAAHCLLPERPCLLTYCISVWYAGCSSADIWWKPSAFPRCCCWSLLKVSQKQQRWRHWNLKVLNPHCAARVCTVLPPKVFGFNVVKSHQCQHLKAKYDKWSWGSSPHPTHRNITFFLQQSMMVFNGSV